MVWYDTECPAAIGLFNLSSLASLQYFCSSSYQCFLAWGPDKNGLRLNRKQVVRVHSSHNHTHSSRKCAVSTGDPNRGSALDCQHTFTVLFYPHGTHLYFCTIKNVALMVDMRRHIFAFMYMGTSDFVTNHLDGNYCG